MVIPPLGDLLVGCINTAGEAPTVTRPQMRFVPALRIILGLPRPSSKDTFIKAHSCSLVLDRFKYENYLSFVIDHLSMVISGKITNNK
jgi:hypothetical protein